MRAAGVARGAHAELARRVARQEPAAEHAAVDHAARRGGDALVVEGGAAELARPVRILVEVDVRREHRRAQGVDQEARLAVERAAAGGLHEVPDQAGGERRLEEHRNLARAELARPQPRQRALGRVAPDRLRIGQPVRVAGRRVPVVALHRAAAPGDRGAGDRMAAVRIAAEEAQAVGRHEVAMAERDARALGVDDRAVGGEGGPLHLPRDLDRLGGLDGPRVEEVEVLGLAHDGVRIGQAGEWVLAGEAGDLEGGAHGLVDGPLAEVAGAGMAAARADVHRDPEALVASLLDGLDTTLADVDRQAGALGHVGGGRGRAEPGGPVEHRTGEFLEACAAVIEHRANRGRMGAGYHSKAP